MKKLFILAVIVFALFMSHSAQASTTTAQTILKGCEQHNKDGYWPVYKKCYVEGVIKNKDYSLCDLFNNSVLPKSVIIRTDRGDCYDVLYRMKDDVKICSYIGEVQDSYRTHNECYLYYARKHKDIKLCNIMRDDVTKSEDCFRSNIHNLKNTNQCASIKYSKTRDGCWLNYAAKYNDKKACSKIENEFYKAPCLRQLIRNEKDINCSNYKELEYESQDNCFHNIALIKKDVAFCDKINNREYKDGCYASVGEYVGIKDVFKSKKNFEYQFYLTIIAAIAVILLSIIVIADAFYYFRSKTSRVLYVQFIIFLAAYIFSHVQFFSSSFVFFATQFAGVAALIFIFVSIYYTLRAGYLAKQQTKWVVPAVMVIIGYLIADVSASSLFLEGGFPFIGVLYSFDWGVFEGLQLFYLIVPFFPNVLMILSFIFVIAKLKPGNRSYNIFTTIFLIVLAIEFALKAFFLMITSIAGY